MLTKQELDNIRAATEPWKGIADVQAPVDVSELLAMLDHIAELEENATAQALALKAAKAMQQAETERADANQAKIDALMFEYCHDEMTEEQNDKWAISQAVSKFTKPDIAALIAISNGEDLPNGK